MTQEEKVDIFGTTYQIQSPENSSSGTLSGTIFVPEGLVRRMSVLWENLSAAYLSEMTSMQEDKPQYKNKHKSYKQKGGSRSPAIKLVEVYIDFDMAMKAGDYPTALTNYYYLKRTLSL